MTIQRDFSTLPNARLLSLIWRLPLPAHFLWRLEAFLCWFSDALSGKVREPMPPVDGAMGVSFGLRVPFASLGILNDLITFEISERTPFDPAETLAVYRLRPCEGELQILIAVIPKSELPKGQSVPLAGGMLYSVPTNEAFPRQFTSPALIGVFAILVLGTVSSTILDGRLSAEEAAMQAIVAEYRGAAHAAVTLRNQQDERMALAQAASRLRGTGMRRTSMLGLLSGALPSSVWLAKLEVSGKTVRITGYAPSAADVIALLNRTDGFTQPRFAAPVAVDDDGLETFTIEFVAGGEAVP